MKDKVYEILKHSAVYSIGNIALKGMGIITLPIYTHYLTRAEVGTFGLVDITINIIAEVLILGQANSIILFNNKREYGDKKNNVFYTITVFVLLINLLFVLAAELFGETIFSLSKSTKDLTAFLPFIIYISLIRVVNNLFLNKLRADEKSAFFTLITLIKIITFVGLIFYTVVHLKLSVYGIMYSYLLSEIVILMIQLPGMIVKMNPRFEKEALKTALKFGMPLVFSSIGILILNLSDRYLINHYINLEEVGIYDIAYRVAGIVNMFLILPFSQAMLPAAFKAAGDSANRRYLSKLMTYMCYVIVWGGLAISIFSDEIIYILGSENYADAKIYIPLIVLAYIFSAMRNVASNGLLFSEKTSLIAVITIAAGLLNIALNIIFLPIFGTIAAAYTTLISFIIFYFLTDTLSKKYYSIQYENYKIIKLLLLGIALYFLVSLLTTDVFILQLLIKIIIIGSFPFLLLFVKFYEKIELETISAGIKSLRDPSELKKHFKNLLS